MAYDCNTPDSEKGGKDLLLKICKDIDIDVDIAGTDDDPTHILSTAHGAEVGDLVEFPDALGTITSVNSGRLYVVKEVISANAFTISDIVGGSAISFSEAVVDLGIKLFNNIGGLRTNSFAFSSDGIENSNRGTNQWRKLVNGAGMRQLSLSGDGVYNNSATFELLESRAFNNVICCLAFVEAITGKIYHGLFKITAIEASGAYDGEATYTFSAVSSGQVEIEKLIVDV